MSHTNSLSHQKKTSAHTQCGVLKPVVLAIQFVFVGSVLFAVQPGMSFAQSAAIQKATYDFQIPAGNLATALRQAASQAGVILSFTPAQTNGKNTQGAHGNLTVDQVLATLLSGTGLSVERGANGSYALQSSLASDHSVLPEVTVQASVDAGAVTENSGSYAARLVTVGKGKQAIKDIPQSVSVITRQRMDDQNITTLDGALANTTGITMYDSPMGGRYVYSRGFMVSSYQFDGVNRAFYYPQANNFISNAAILDRVEVVRGATGLLQGAGSPGATVNMVRKRPLADKQLLLSASAGSWNNYRTEADITGPLNEEGTLRGRAIASFNDKETFYDLGNSNTGVLYGILEYDLSTHTKLTGGVSYERTKSRPFFNGLPRYTNGQDLKLSRSTYLGADWNRWTNEQTSVFAEVEHQFNADWTIKTTLNYSREQNDVKYAFPLGAINPVTLVGALMYGGVFDMFSDNKSIDVMVDGKFDALGRKHSVSFGASRSWLNSINDFSLADLQLGNNVFNPNHYIPEPSDAELLAKRYRGALTNTKMKQTGAYGVARFSVTDPLTVVLGARVSWYEMASRNRSTGAVSGAPYKESAVVTPYGGLVYALNPQWSAYVSYADIFQPQSAIDYTGKLLDPIIGKNIEAGIKGELMDGKLNAAFALFRIDQTNMSQEDFVNVCRTSDHCYRAAGKVRSQGFDAEISGEVARGLEASVGYTVNLFQYLDKTPDAGVAFASTYTPKHTLRAWTNYRLPGQWQQWSVGGGVNYQTESSRTTGNIKLTQAAYALWEARVGYEINRNWSASLNVANLFDKTYYQTIGAPTWGNFYGNPRNFTLVLRGKF